MTAASQHRSCRPANILCLALLLGFVATGLVPNPVEAKDKTEKIKQTVTKYLKKKYGEDLRRVEKSKNAYLEKYLKDYEIYEVNVFNKVSMIAGREEFLFTVLVNKKKNIVILETEKDILAFLNKRALKVDNENIARDMAYLYAGLKRIDVVESAKNLDAACSYLNFEPRDEEKQISPLAVKAPTGKGKAAWSVVFFAVTDPFICAVSKFSLRITAQGSWTIKEDWLSTRSGYD